MNRQIVSSLVFAAGVLGLAFGARMLNEAGLASLEAARVNGVIAGLILVWFGNLMPKKNPERSCGQDPGASFRMKRMAGFLLMLGGIGHAVAWLALPLDQAKWIAMIPVAVALVIVLATAFRSRVWV